MDILLEILTEMAVEGVSQGGLCAKLPRPLRIFLAGLTIAGILAAAVCFLLLSVQLNPWPACLLGLAPLCVFLLRQYMKRLRCIK